LDEKRNSQRNKGVEKKPTGKMQEGEKRSEHTNKGNDEKDSPEIQWMLGGYAVGEVLEVRPEGTQDKGTKLRNPVV